MNGLLYFTADSSTGQRELYVSDGTGPGTTRVKNLYGEGTSADPSDLTVVNNRLYFVATTDTNDRELHVSDGTAAGTELVLDIGGQSAVCHVRLRHTTTISSSGHAVPMGRRSYGRATGQQPAR